MNLTTLRGGLEFWNFFAPWYEDWLTRGTYHGPVIRELSEMIEPGWNVLDIGAGTGALSIPLASLGCHVTAIEPSGGMRRILQQKIKSLNVTDVDIYNSRLEDFPVERATDMDLAIVCNSAHLADGGLLSGMSRVFALSAMNVTLVTEVNQGFTIDFKEVDSIQDEYNFLFIKNLTLDSSYYFNDMDEVDDLSEFLDRKIDIVMEDGKPVQHDSTDVAVIWWERR